MVSEPQAGGNGRAGLSGPRLSAGGRAGTGTARPWLELGARALVETLLATERAMNSASGERARYVARVDYQRAKFNYESAVASAPASPNGTAID
jgi:hypothetical protein